MVPTFEKFLYPFLLCLKDGEMSVKDLRLKLIEYFKLAPEDVQIRTKSGNTTQFNDRIGWARQYFRRALFIDIPQNGVYRLTERGRDYLSKHDSLTIDDLLAYPEYAEYASRKTKGETVESAAIQSKEELTPQEQMESAFEIISNDLAEQILDKVKKQTPQFFERLVVKLLVAMGYGGSFDNAASVTQYSHDEGIDGIIKEDKLGLDSIYVQAKRYDSGVVGRKEIQSFVGALTGKGANKGVFITTSTFTKEALSYKPMNGIKVVLIDGVQLASYMIDFNIGVSTRQVFEIKRIDTDFFAEEE